MKTYLQNLLLALVLLAGIHQAAAQGTAFSYQGKLNDGANPATGLYDVRFSVCDALTNGSVIAGTLTNTATGITNGLFSVTLDFGAGVFTGPARWLQLDVRTNGTGAFSTLSPRQPITPTPYAIYSANAGSAATAITAGTAGSANSVSAANIVGTVPLAQLPGTILTNGSSGVNLAGTFSGNGAGVTNVNLLSINSGGAIGYVTNFNYSTNAYITNIVSITTNYPAATNSAGKFVLAATLNNVGNATWLATMDVNNDGKLDLLVASGSSSAVIILTNNGAGVFGLYSTVTDPHLASPNSILLADVNGDNRLDLICVRGLAQFGVVVFTNNGTGNFGYSAFVGTYGNFPRVAAAADFNGDNRIDLVTDDTSGGGSNVGGLTVITNNVSGTLGQNSNLAAGYQPYCVTAADINGDGKVDIIAGNTAAVQGALTIYTNTGTGQFILQSTNYPGISSATYVIATSIHADTNLDLVVADKNNNNLFVLTNNGSGVFGSNATLAVGSTPFYVLATDVNGDGKPDLISANYGSGTLTAWTNNGSGIFGSNNTYIVGSQPLCLAAANMNGDGQQFLFCANSGSSTVSVFTNGSGGFTNSTTYTTNSIPVTNSVVTATGTTNINFNGSFIGNGGGLTNVNVAQLPGMVLTNNESGVILNGTFSGNGSGLTNLNVAQLPATVLTNNQSGVTLSGTFSGSGINLSGLWKTGGNSGTTPGTDFLGTSDNQALELKVNNSRVLRLEPDGNSPRITGGYSGNVANNSGATVGGGGQSGSINQVTGQWGTVAGGRGNTSSASDATVSGGSGNTASGQNASVSGGANSTASAAYAVVSGGTSGTASGTAATVPGGFNNIAAGDESFAAGTSARANHAGTFVWADSTFVNFASTANNQFLIRAAGGVGIGKNNPATALDVNGTVTATSFIGNGNGLTNTTTAANYVFAYDTTTQASSPTFQDVTFSANGQLNGWTHTAGTAAFTCGQSGLYSIEYTGEISPFGSGYTASLIAVLNGTEIVGSQSSFISLGGGVTTLSKSFLVSVNSGDALKIQFITTGGPSELITGAGSGTTKPSISCTIIRIK